MSTSIHMNPNHDMIKFDDDLSALDLKITENRLAKIHSVKEIDIVSNEGLIYISVFGETTTSGWKNGTLIPWIYVTEPQDGIQDFDCVASPPNSIVLDVISPINCAASMYSQSWIKGIRVHSSSNSLVKLIDDKLSHNRNLFTGWLRN